MDRCRGRGCFDTAESYHLDTGTWGNKPAAAPAVGLASVVAQEAQARDGAELAETVAGAGAGAGGATQPLSQPPRTGRARGPGLSALKDSSEFRYSSSYTKGTSGGRVGKATAKGVAAYTGAKTTAASTEQVGADEGARLVASSFLAARFD
eukprot:COSAG01_NODE_803_length_13459_cov_9.995808_11_plen_151_part_00